MAGELSTCVAWNSSQVSDGAAALLIGCRSVVAALGLPVLGVLRGSAVVWEYGNRASVRHPCGSEAGR